MQNQRRCPLLGNSSVNTSPWQQNHVTTATDIQATIQEELEVAFSVGSMLRLYTRDQT
jgi:hypothetical protein